MYPNRTKKVHCGCVLLCAPVVLALQSFSPKRTHHHEYVAYPMLTTRHLLSLLLRVIRVGVLCRVMLSRYSIQ